MSGWKDYRDKKSEVETPKLTLLVVDDEERILQSIAGLFEGRYRVVTANGGDEALRRFAECRPELVLCDQRMPGQSGIEILKVMGAKEPGTIRMLITGYSDIDVVIEALNDAVLHRYVTKPWENDALVAVVDEAARRYVEENGLTDGPSEILF